MLPPRCRSDPCRNIDVSRLSHTLLARHARRPHGLGGDVTAGTRRCRAERDDDLADRERALLAHLERNGGMPDVEGNVGRVVL